VIYGFATHHYDSTTQALLVLVKRTKKAIIKGKEVGVVFFDFADAFESVNRNLLVLKLGKDFQQCFSSTSTASSATDLPE